MSKIRGFTLVELLVVISILAILAVVGATLYSSVSKSSRDAKRKADIEAIAKAYETSYQSGSYQTLTASNFASGTIPQTPSGGDYYNIKSDDGAGFLVCAALEGYPTSFCNSPSSSCYCISSVQGTINTSATISGTGYSEIGYNTTCSTSLSQSLIGYWKMDEGSGTTITDSTNNNQPLSRGTLNWTGGKVGPYAVQNANGAGGSISDSGFLEGMSSLTISAWVYPTQLDSTDRSIVRKGEWNSSPLMSYRLMYQTDWGSGPGYPKGAWRFHIKTSSGEYSAMPISSTSDPKENKWHLISGTFSSSDNRIRIYDSVDGVTTELANTAASGTVNLNDYTTDVGRSFIGTIDDVRMYNRALSPEEINILYSNGFGCTP